MHMGARIPAARCLAQVQVFANALAVAPRLDNKVLFFSPRQTRLVSSKPDSSSDKPPESAEEGKEEGKDKESEHASQPPTSSETSESATEAKRQPLFAPLGGRGRSNNSSGTNSGLPRFTLPLWFLDNQIQILDSEIPTTGKRWDGIWRYLKPLRSETTSIQAIGGIWASSEHGQASSEPPERAIGRELVSTVSAELEAIAPSHRATKEARRRPISLLYVHNYKGSRVANDVIGHIGADLGADVVHLDAIKIARLIAPYFGSTLYFGRGKMSMLGYAVAEANGRARVASFSAGSDGEEDFLSIRGMGVMKFLQSGDNERVTWDDLKLNYVAKELANAVNIKRKQTHPKASKPERVILHIHNYIELMMTPEGATILNKLRTVVDRLWQDGSKIVIVGSASNDDNASAQWHTKVKELSSQDCYPFVFSPRADDLPELKAWEQNDYLMDNLSNISWMLECLKANPAELVMPARKSSEPVEVLDELRDCLSSGICTNHWVFRLCTQAIGCQRYRDSPLDVHTLAEALRHMRRVDSTRSTILGIQDTSNLPSAAVADSSSSPLASLVSLGNNRPEVQDRRKTPRNVNFDDEEKKLVSGLVDVRDIHTTFDDVIAPPDVRDSLIALTTLSLQHPKAFSYGVLARERIHGALLYGPPGTGKTLMAKALAKGSGANMLEISAASINDMWVGNSEKNVRAVFSLARKMSPMIVFLDEADSLLGSRARQPNRGGYRETINQFLREWDGLTNSINTQQIFILVSTNRPQDIDEAVLRRLPRRILVDLPLKDSRLAILQSLLRDETVGDDVSLDRLATDTELYSGSDLKNLAVAAAMEAAKEELVAKNIHSGPEAYEFPAKRVLTKRHFDKAVKDITASISEDMQSLKALRKFDSQYGDARRKKKKSHIGFEVVPRTVSSEDARVRSN
ncbi:hypothetical protein N0V82_009133 [Gnomoniopsis sp. IMI 355080]|nr:hypothetical protein N0V82_009133 [Gnomoniopsis sp. IMI 355080]